MKMVFHRDERGQVIIILAMAMVALLAFAALALDGGNVYTEQRRAQSGADNAVLAAAYQQMNGVHAFSTLNASALANAAQNGYNNDGTSNAVSYHHPPISGAYAGNNEYMQVFITKTVPTALIHMVYQGPVRLTVNAVAHSEVVQPLMAGYAIAAMNPGVCNGNDFTARGGVESIIEGGGVFVNADCDDEAMNMTGHGKLATTTTGVYPPDGSFPITVVGTVTGNNGTNCAAPPTPPYSPADCNFYPPAVFNAPQVDSDPMAQTPVQPGDIPCGPAQTPGGGNPVNVTPGSYTNLNVGNKTLIMAPGIYCITGVGSANKVLDADSIVGHGVFIYIQQTLAEFKFAGHGVLDLSAPGALDCQADASLCPYLGIVIYKPYGRNTCGNDDIEIAFSGNAEMIVSGLIYAPQSYAEYGGNGDLTMVGQAIVGCVKYAGNGELNVIYDPDATYIPPPRVRLDQ
jgi:Flp pilus assembly protein TadG